MSASNKILNHIRYLWHRSRFDEELRQEVEFHIEASATEIQRAGVSRSEAVNIARRQFGSEVLMREESHDAWSFRWLEDILGDLRFGIRVFWKSRGLSTIAVFTLALGIGANTTIFSWINSTFLDPLPGVTQPRKLVSIYGGSPAEPQVLSYPDYKDLRDWNHTLSGFAAFKLRPMSLTGAGNPERIWGTLVTSNYFEVLGVEPVLGRGFLPDDDRSPGGVAVAVISYQLWRTRFDANPSVIGRTLDLNEHPYIIVGVAPAVFQGAKNGLRSEVWIPITMAQQFYQDGDWLNPRDTTWLDSIGRLKPGVTRSQAQSEMTLLMRRIAREYPNVHPEDISVIVFPLWSTPGGVNTYLRPILVFLTAAGVVVLILVWVNIANLLLVRFVTRRREIAVRLAIGASRSRLVRQFLVESLILSLCGGFFSIPLAFLGSGTLSRFIPAMEFPIWIKPTVDRNVLLVTIAASLVSGVIVGVIPAFRSSSFLPIEVLKEESTAAAGGARKARLSNVLAVAQIALSFLLLICAGLFIRSFRFAESFNTGFNTSSVFTASYDLFSSGYNEANGPDFHRQLLANLAAIPGIEAATLANRAPLDVFSSSAKIALDDYVPQQKEKMKVDFAQVAPNYFRTLQIPLVEGRDFKASDSPRSEPVAIISQKFVDRYWQNQRVLGRRVYIRDAWRTVIGVAGDSKYENIRESSRPFVYLPLFQQYTPVCTILLRVAKAPSLAALAAQKALHEVNPSVPLFNITTMKSRIEFDTMDERIGSIFVGGFGFLALVLSTIGIYGVIAQATSQRTHEVGIRIALGAERRAVLSLVLGHGLRLTFLGIGIGLLAALGTTRILSAELFGVTPTDPPTFLAVAFVLTFVALTASYLPARKAMQVDPLTALRYE